MALIECPECGKEISDKAASCPNCGTPVADAPVETSNTQAHVKVTRTGAKWEGIGFMLIIGGVIAGIATESNNHIGAIIGSVGFVLFIIGRFK